jgi:hypothetical protein
MDFGSLVVVAIIASIIWLFSAINIAHGAVAFGVWLLLILAIAANNGTSIGTNPFVLFSLGVPAVAGIIGGIMGERDRTRGDQLDRARRADIPDDAVRFPNVLYGGGAPNFPATPLELCAEPNGLWLMPAAPSEKPLFIPAGEIADLRVLSHQEVQTRTDFAGGIVWGGGAAKSTVSVGGAQLVLSWVHKGKSYELEFAPRGGSPSLTRDLHARLQIVLDYTNASTVPLSGALRVPCPFCAEMIMPAAKVCRFCSSELNWMHSV